jgi:two-component system chemotaxis response regulator CheB
MNGPTTEPTFGRHQLDGTITDLGCPECRGVLAVRDEGRKGYLLFVCRVGHSYSPQSIIEAKEEGLESDLWSAVARLDELVSLYEDFVARMRRMQRPELAEAYGVRLEKARGVLARLQTLVQENGPTPEPRAP